jgi:hypothetical protein
MAREIAREKRLVGDQVGRTGKRRTAVGFLTGTADTAMIAANATMALSEKCIASATKGEF